MSWRAAEVTISLSRIIKSHAAHTEESKGRTIKIRAYDHGGASGISAASAETMPFQEEVEQARTEAASIIEAARAEAAAVFQDIEQARTEWEQTEKPELVQEAAAKGYEEGLKQGRMDGRNEYKEAIGEAVQVIDAAKEDYGRHLENAEQTILDLSIAVAEKILGKTIEEDGSFLALVKRAVKEAREYKEVQLHVHPDQYPEVLAHKDELYALFPKDVDFYVYPDTDLNPYNCFIDSANGKIDAAIDSQLTEIKAKLAALLEGE